MSLGFSEKIRYSVTQLLKDKPERLEGFDFICDEDYYVEINGVIVFAEDYQIIYGNGYIVLRFYNSEGDCVATLNAFEGTNDNPEGIVVMNGKIFSETALKRVKEWME